MLITRPRINAGRPCRPLSVYQGGIGLIELLVSLLVFSLGVLALASLQGVAKKANYDALQRSNAAMLAHGMLERMRSNGASVNTYLQVGDLGGGTRGENAPAACTLAAPCTPQQLAAFDLWEWERMLDGFLETRSGVETGGLVTPTACIAGPAGGGNGVYTVAIAWRGVTELSNPVINPCGSGLGRYGGADRLRRVLVVQSFISTT